MMSREVVEPGFVLALSAAPGQVNPLVQLIPFALVLGIWLGGEAVTGFEWAAAAVITAGVVLLVIGRRAVKAPG